MEIKDFKFKRRTTRSHTVLIYYNPNDYKINKDRCMKKDESVEIRGDEIIDTLFNGRCTKKGMNFDVPKDDTVKIKKVNHSSLVCGILGQQLENMKKSVHFACRKNWPYSMYFRGCIEGMEDESGTDQRKTQSNEGFGFDIFDTLSENDDFEKKVNITCTNNFIKNSQPDGDKLPIKENTRILNDITNTYHTNVDKTASNTESPDMSNISFKEKIVFYENLFKIEETDKGLLSNNRKEISKPPIKDINQNPAVKERSFDFQSLLRKWESASNRKL